MRSTQEVRSARPWRRVGIVVCVAVLGGTGLTYWLLSQFANANARSRGTGPNQQRAKTSKLGENWYSSHLEFWQSLGFVSLRDRQALEANIRHIIEGPRLGDVDVDAETLIRDLTAFLHALAAESPKDYLRCLSGRRILRDNLFLDTSMHGWYREATGEQLTRDTPAEEALAKLWQVGEQGVGRPAAVANRALVQVGQSRPLPPEGLAPGYLLFNATAPEYPALPLAEAERWMGPFGQGFPRVTQPILTYEDIFGRQGPVVICELCVPMRSERGVVFSASIGLYFSPDDRSWHVQYFANYYPYWVCWPY